MKNKLLLPIIIFSIFSFTSTGYAQCIEGDCVNGKGKYIYKNSSSYSGDFKDSLAHGYGKCLYDNGNSYEGHWKKNEFHGEGTYYNRTGKVVKGVWENGKMLKVLNITEHEVPKTWAIIIGVAAYSHFQRLRYTDDDAYKLFAFLKSPEGGAIPDEQMSLMIDELATKENIIKSLRDFSVKVGPDDILIFYFSGHGEKDYLMPFDYDGVYNKLSYAEVNSLLQQTKAKHKICLTDACHSGGMYAIKGVPSSSNYKNEFDVFGKNEDEIAILVSSRSDEKSLESTQLRQGTFSHFLIKGLKGESDRNRDNIVTITELHDYVHRQVKSYTNNAQTPSLYGNFNPDMPINKVRGTAKVMSH
jgi:hypothetical protein